MAEKPASVWDRKTLTGLTLKDALAQLDRDMGKAAYKPVKAQGRTFTDIHPHHSYALLDEVFGPLGIGWGFTVEQLEYVGFRTYKSKTSGNEITEHIACATVRCWYVLDDGTRAEWGPVPGGSKNGERNYAEQGAVTNAVGKGFSFLGLQRHVYKNEPAPEVETRITDEPMPDVTAQWAVVVAGYKTSAERKGRVMAALGNPASGAEALGVFAGKSEAERGLIEKLAKGEIESLEAA